jgi:hypothetical protein
MNSSSFILTTLSKSPEYFEKIVALIEEEFLYDQRNHFDRDFAPLINPHNFDNCYFFIDKESNSVAAHLAVCPRKVIKNEIEMNVTFIGGIATQKKFRGQSLFKNLMEHALEEHMSSTGLFILWSDIENLYEKFSFNRTGGFFESGSKAFIQGEIIPGFNRTKFNQLTDTDFNRITQLYTRCLESHLFTIKRDEKDWSIIRDMESIDVFIRRDGNGEIDRYFCANKGKDLNHVIHEIGASSDEQFKVLLKETAHYRTWLPECLPHQGKDIFFTAFFRIGSAKVLNQFLKDITGNDLDIISASEEKVVFDFKRKQYEASPKDFLHHLFGPKPLTEFSELGLSLYVCGADSI